MEGEAEESGIRGEVNIECSRVAFLKIWSGPCSSNITGNLLEKGSISPHHLRSVESETLVWGPAGWVFTSPLCDPHAHCSRETPVLEGVQVGAGTWHRGRGTSAGARCT